VVVALCIDQLLELVAQALADWGFHREIHGRAEYGTDVACRYQLGINRRVVASVDPQSVVVNGPAAFALGTNGW